MHTRFIFVECIWVQKKCKWGANRMMCRCSVRVKWQTGQFKVKSEFNCSIHGCTRPIQNWLKLTWCLWWIEQLRMQFLEFLRSRQPRQLHEIYWIARLIDVSIRHTWRLFSSNNANTCKCARNHKNCYRRWTINFNFISLAVNRCDFIPRCISNTDSNISKREIGERIFMSAFSVCRLSKLRSQPFITAVEKQMALR